MKKFLYSVLALAAVACTSCKNSDQKFDDFEGGKIAYFPYQTPIRTIMLGEDVEINTDLDNAHKFIIMGVGMGAYNSYDFAFQVNVKPTLIEQYAAEKGVEAMPQSYYTISSPVSTYYGNYMSGIEVQLTDAFFQDPKSLTAHYVIPMEMSDVRGADFINEDLNYTLYCVRYVNPWEGYYILRQGTTEAELLKSPIVQVTTTSLTTCNYKNNDGIEMTLTFSGDNCTISGGATGSGTFGHGTEIKAFGDRDRNALYLKYTAGGKSYDETLVLQRRGDFAGTIKEF